MDQAASFNICNETYESEAPLPAISSVTGTTSARSLLVGPA